MASSPASSSSAAPRRSSPSMAHPTKPSVQALLAQLSDSDDELSIPSRASTAKGPASATKSIDAEESSDDDGILGGGRLATRLAGDAPGDAATVQDGNVEKQAAATVDMESSSDELNQPLPADASALAEPLQFKPTRRLLLKRKRAVQDADDDSSPAKSRHTLSQPSSPRGPPSPSPSTRPSQQKSPAATATSRQQNADDARKSKFSVLVEKARRERLAREEAERAKKAEREPQESSPSPKRRGQRGSSPADDSEEESDRSEVAAAKRLTKGSRPARKASKKALEEMNRETQRMNRNMQLAHQARTKKRFTKESFFASFNHVAPSLPVVAELSQDASSSMPSSDAENANQHSTPPTSPMLGPEPEATKETAASSVAKVTTQPTADDGMDDELDFLAMIASRSKEKAHTAQSSNDRLATSAANQPGQPATRVSLAHSIQTQNNSDSDSGSDVEVVFEKGLKRKYAAFENLPKRKAKETSSHLALRSLAQVKQEKNKKSSMSPADMSSRLLRAARRQALEERQAKIEKLKAAGVTIQTAEEREQAEEELEDLVERARQEEEEIRKREKQLAKKDGTYVKDALDDDDSDEDDSDFEDEQDDEGHSGSEEEEAEEAVDESDGNEADDEEHGGSGLIDVAAEESEQQEASDAESSAEDRAMETAVLEDGTTKTPMPTRVSRISRVVADEDDEEDGTTVQVPQSPALPSARKTPQSIVRSARKIIPGLPYSDDQPIDLTQAFAATMADSQTQQEPMTQEQDSMDMMRSLPSPRIDIVPRLNRLESLDMVSESVSGSQTQPLNVDLGFSQSQQHVPGSPALLSQVGPSQPFELTQDAGYSFSPFVGNRFAETPSKEPHSTIDTVILEREEQSPVMRRKGRLRRGQQADEGEEVATEAESRSAFNVMKKAAKRKLAEEFKKKNSEARQAFDEAAEESDDEYAGLGGASDDDSGVEDEDDHRMIDEDTQVGQGDEARLAKLHADRERESDEQAVSKLLKDITTGALRRKRGAGDDLDLSDEEDAAARRRATKRREFAKMRRELLKDEAVGKIAEDKKKEAFLKSIEDRDEDDEDDDDFDTAETRLGGDESQTQDTGERDKSTVPTSSSNALKAAANSRLNQIDLSSRRPKAVASRKPGTLAEIRESVSFLIEEPDSQAGVLDLGLSDSEEEPEAYVDLDRHIAQAEADETAVDDENEDLGDFIVDDEDTEKESQDSAFKKPELPAKARDRGPFAERRTKAGVVDRLSLLRQSSSSSSAGSNAASKMAFVARSSSGGFNLPSLLKRATTNSSLGSISGRENVSSTGVVTSKTERGGAAQEKEYVRKGLNSNRNAINYQGRQNLKEEKMSARAGIVKRQQQQKKKAGSGFLGELLRRDTWA